MSDSEKAKARPRSITSLTLKWMAERVRRAEKIKKQVAKGKYRVNSEEIAAAIINEEMRGSS
jgi:anti-sigma28 factor (negative regulator of flagellin synthesis)